jgi:hypothetical protein
VPYHLRSTGRPINLNTFQILFAVLHFTMLNTALVLLCSVACCRHSLGTVSSAAVVDDSSVGATVGMEHEPVHKVLLREICPQDIQQ